jgi:hypothetical protein
MANQPSKDELNEVLDESFNEVSSKDIEEALGAKVEEWVEVGGGGDEQAHDFDLEPTLNGVYVEKREGVGSNNSNIYVIENKQNIRVGMWGSTVIDDRMKKIDIGTEIKVEYIGKKKSANNRYVKQFRVFKKA